MFLPDAGRTSGDYERISIVHTRILERQLIKPIHELLQIYPNSENPDMGHRELADIRSLRE
jgi:Protein of unknown function (DUF3719).